MRMHAHLGQQRRQRQRAESADAVDGGASASASARGHAGRAGCVGLVGLVDACGLDGRAAACRMLPAAARLGRLMGGRWKVGRSRGRQGEADGSGGTRKGIKGETPKRRWRSPAKHAAGRGGAK